MVSCCPDTGATQSVLSERIARQANLEFLQPRISMVGLTGHGVNVIAEADVILTYDGIRHRTSVLIADNIGDTMLVAWHDLQDLDIITRNFPARIRSVTPSLTMLKQMASQLMGEFPSVFKDELSESPMNVPEMKIYLTEKNVPFRVSTARQVPLRFQEAADKAVSDLLAAKVITREVEPQPWCAPGFWVPKPDGKRVRLVTDYTKLNQFVRRPVHPFPSVKDIVQSIPAGTQFFAKMDAVHGYFQLALDEESSKLTTFLLPSGRYRYLRAPMGLSCSSDEWCRHSDRAIEGLAFARKIVDDILVWSNTLPLLHERIKIIAARCADLNIILSRKKFEMGPELSFAGLILNSTGVKPDPLRIVALTDFPAPTDVTGVRSFLGLANQLAGFVPDFAHMTVKLRALTAKKNAFIWLEEHQKEFETVKRLLTSDMVVTHFNPLLPVTVLTDASRLHGLGFAMGHYVGTPSRFRLVCCGSRSLTPTQQRYATIELECLAVHFAITKCSFYLKGANSFTVATDHKPLEGIFQKELFGIGNPRLQRIREKLIEYSFVTRWVPGKNHHIADALSRAPLFAPEEDDDMVIDTARVCLARTVDRNNELTAVLDSVDSDYIQFRHDVLEGTCKSEYARLMKAVMSQLSVDDELVYLDAKRIVMPRKAVVKILKLVHVSHIGVNKTYDLCRSLYFWPGMLNDIKQMIAQCRPCSIHRPSLPKNPRVTNPPSDYMGPPMCHVGLDLFDFGGQKHLICVDQWSGYPLFATLSSQTSAAVIKQLHSWFNTLGWPKSLRVDGGPQFRSAFIEFCAKNSIVHERSAPYNPRSNGLAESAVKVVKSILLKCLGEKSDVQRALYEWRNAPRAHGYSPAQLLFGRSQKMLLPQPDSAFQQVSFEEAAVAKDKQFAGQEEHYNRDKVDLELLQPGQLVRVQSEKDKTWESVGTVVEIRPDQLSYLVDLNGLVSIRCRSMLRPKTDFDQGQSSDPISVGVSNKENVPTQPNSPRRSSRIANQKEVKVQKERQGEQCAVLKKTTTAGLNTRSGGSTLTHIMMSPTTGQSARPQEGSPSLMSNGRPLPPGQPPLSWLHSSFSSFSCASGAGGGQPSRSAVGTPSSFGSCRPGPALFPRPSSQPLVSQPVACRTQVLPCPGQVPLIPSPQASMMGGGLPARQVISTRGGTLPCLPLPRPGIIRPSFLPSSTVGAMPVQTAFQPLIQRSATMVGSGPLPTIGVRQSCHPGLRKSGMNLPLVAPGPGLITGVQSTSVSRTRKNAAAQLGVGSKVDSRRRRGGPLPKEDLPKEDLPKESQRPECILTSRVQSQKQVVPKMSLAQFNATTSSVPGNVFSMKVRF